MRAGRPTRFGPEVARRRSTTHAARGGIVQNLRRQNSPIIGTKHLSADRIQSDSISSALIPRTVYRFEQCVGARVRRDDLPHLD